MAIFRGTGGSGNSTDDSIVSAVTTQAGIATTKADEASASATTATTKASEASASATTATTKATEANTAKTGAETAKTGAETAKTAAEDAQTAAESARDTAQTHANTANNSSVQTVAGISTEVQNLDSIKTDITGVNTIKSDVTTVAGISSNVTTVAADASDIGTVATNIANVNSVGDNISNVNSVAGNATNINTVAADGTDIGTVASNISDVNTVAGISSNVTTVAGLESKMDTVIADASDIGAVAGNISDVSTVAGINADVDTVAGISAKVTTVADNIADVQNADTNAANASASASQAANSATAAGTSATTASTKATEASNSATAASNSATTATTKATEAAGSATTATTKASEASTSATNAATSATTATTKASEAASSATAASGSATTATTKASEADVSANSAASSATDATNASNTWSNFYTTYLGAADAPPTVDVQGNALQTGAFYYDTGAGSNTVGLYVYNGSTWIYSTNYSNVTAPYILAQDLNANGNDIISTGKLGIGTSSPQKLFEVSSNSSPTVRISNTRNDTLWDTDPVFGALEFYSHDGSGSGASVRSKIQAEAFTEFGNATDLVFYSGDALGVATEGMRLSYTGRLGIGADEPNNRLHIKHSDNELARFESTDPAVLISLKDNTATSRIQNLAGKLSLQADTGSEGADSRIDFKVDGSEKMRIKSNGNVGIGTSSPSEALEVNGKVKADTHFTSSDGTVTLSTSGNGGAVYLRPNGNSQSSGQVIVNSSGKVGIGTSSPNRPLTVESSDVGLAEFESTNSTSKVYFKDSGTTNTYSVAVGSVGDEMAFYASSGGAERMRIDSSGNVGIGTDSPSAQLHVKNNTGVKLTDSTSARHLNITPALLDGTPAIIESTSANGLRLNASGSGAEVQLYSNNTERMRIDSSGNLGIGTSSPSEALTVSGNIQIEDNDGYLQFKDSNAGADNKLRRIYNAEQNLYISRRNDDGTLESNDVVIDSSGNVGIGTDSPATKLNIIGGTTGTDVDVVRINGTNSAFNIKCSDLSANNPVWTLRTFDSEALAFGDGITENMRIDASGNLLVGKTGSGSNIVGFQAGQDGFIAATRASAQPLVLNRTTNDGIIADFRKDSTSVGSISTVNGDIYLGTGNVNLRFTDSANDIRPVNSSGVNLDNTVDLGASATRFKDLYLSGGVHLGGTGSANKLDDYEEGTFTLTTYGDSTGAFNGTPTCLYTKIGNTVNVLIAFRVGTNFTGQTVGGLPFTTSHTGMSSSYISGGIVITSNNNTVSTTVAHNGTTIRFHDNQNTSDAHLPNTTDEYYRLNFTYKTA